MTASYVRKKAIKLSYASLFILFSVAASPVYADQVTVCTSGCDFTTIQTAIDDPGTVNGDSINVLASTHIEQGIVVNKSVNIRGQDVASTIVQAHANRNSASDRVFKITGGNVITITNMTIRHGVGNGAEFGGDITGGGIFVDNGASLTLQNCSVTDNDSEFGGGIYVNGGTLTISQCTISNNHATGYDHRGGGIRNNNGLIHISESTISGNSAYSGGGINNRGGDINIINVTISGNSAGFTGGGIYNELVGADIIVDNSTIILNSASSGGGGIYVMNSSVIWLGGTIISGNNGENITNFATTGFDGYNLIGHSGDCNGVCGNATDITPTESFAQIIDSNLSDNGGPTFTHALVTGSPAIEAGDPNGCTVNPLSSAPPPYNANATINIDQRGAVRADGLDRGGNHCDIGAYEANSEQTPTAVSIMSVQGQSHNYSKTLSSLMILGILIGTLLTLRATRRG